LRRGGGDPTHQITADGAFWRTARTASGAVTLRLEVRCGAVEARAWGPGAGEAIDGVPDLLGARDDPREFRPGHPVLREVAARWPGLRIPRTGLVFETLVPTVLEQKVTGVEARRAWRWLLRRYGDPAPGPAPTGMRVIAAPQTWARVPSWDWHRAGVDDKRARTVVTGARAARRLEEAAAFPAGAARARLLALPGVGPWTAAEVAQRALGDADALTLGDLHLPRLVGWVLAGRPFDDAAMVAALAGYAPHRHRVVRLVELSGRGKPRFAPRYAVRDFRAI
jgi:3-methyladenine DNA glycosylase/8-oxoguanine DNA glycosylase